MSAEPCLIFILPDSNTFGSMNLPEQFKSFVRYNRLLSGNQPTLLAVSGGVDSVVMGHLFREAGFPFAVAHCNFRLRGTESDDDEIFVQQLAASWGTPFFTKRFQTKAYAEQHGLSIQMAARELRYSWFHELALEHGYNRIATAHNLNDSVETALLNFVRGTGLSGLGGIAMFTSVNSSLSPSAGLMGMIRPLIFATRSDIETHAFTHQIAWREDISNVSDEYSRNFLRHRIVPLLEELNPNFLHTAARNLARLRETNENLQFLTRYFFRGGAFAASEFFIDKHQLAKLPAPGQALQEMLKDCGFTGEQVRQVADHLEHIGLELRSSSGWRLLNDRDKILLVLSPSSNPTSSPVVATIQPDDLMVALPGGGRLVLMPAEVRLPFPDGRESVLIDAEKLRFPLFLRPWQAGDVFQPFGMGGHSQKLQDFFTNLKLSRFEKEKVRVLVNGDGAIIWIPGYRPDERFKVLPETRKFLKISYLYQETG